LPRPPRSFSAVFPRPFLHFSLKSAADNQPIAQ
jgi:hypothetical protein